MPRRTYTTGSKDTVMRRMARYAISDQEALIDAYTPAYGQPDETAAEVIANARDNIADFRRMAQLSTVSAD
jgi:phage gp36-like protein